MPIYEYQCDNCGHKLEVMQKVSDAPLTGCPECRQDSLRKLVSAASFRLKGTGWYVTDFKNKPDKSKQAKSADGDKKADAGKKEETAGTDKSDTKPKDTGSKDKKEASGAG